MWEGLTKNEAKKNKKNKNSSLSVFPGTRGRQPLPRVPYSGTRERVSSPSVKKGTRGRIFLSSNSVGGVDRQVICFFVECRSSPSVALGEEGLCRVLRFTECQDLFGTRKSLSSPSATLGKDSLSRVPGFWHSGKPETLGKFCLSRSERERMQICIHGQGTHGVVEICFCRKVRQEIQIQRQK